MTPTTEHRVAGAAKLAVGQTQAFGEGTKAGFVLHHQSGFVAFRNACPHWGIDLDMGLGDFYDPKINRVFCRTHGALFVMPSGECTRGPCVGDYLDAWECRVDGDDVVVMMPPPAVLIG